MPAPRQIAFCRQEGFAKSNTFHNAFAAVVYLRRKILVVGGDLKADSVPLNLNSKAQDTALHLAAKNGFVKTLELEGATSI